MFSQKFSSGAQSGWLCIEGSWRPCPPRRRLPNIGHGRLPFVSLHRPRVAWKRECDPRRARPRELFRPGTAARCGGWRFPRAI